MIGFNIHYCPWDKHCKKYDPPNRFHFNTPWGNLMIAFKWGDRAQMWFPWKVKNKYADEGRSHYSDHIFSPIVWNPRRKNESTVR